ncbi:hypothetical protein Harreka1_69 [Olleya phage Harreka_1]|uniref:Uncharacterized protein n=1 Tax=Olleya phage Harreka_1 TaxID=2745673 RepID=A0A8E5EAW6_9CAUD|nr:hypothetical protein M1M26_gp69 [Olleya phage Harreka_1]QQV90476.1 hypothetical protein Harreka1_69 [Olleya phage Harreka_1]
MKLTGQAEKDFNKWFDNTEESKKVIISLYTTDSTDNVYYSDVFDNLPNEAKFGVYQKWFDSVGYFIGNDSWRSFGNIKETFYWFNIKDINQKSLIKETYEESLLTAKKKTRPEAQAAAIEKANELYNNK